MADPKFQTLSEFFDVTDKNMGHVWLLFFVGVFGVLTCLLSLAFKDGKIMYEIGRSIADGGFTTMFYAMKTGGTQTLKP